VIEKYFNDYFDSFKIRKDNIKSNDENVNSLEFNLITYNETLENIEKDKTIKKIINEEEYLNINPRVRFFCMQFLIKLRLNS